MDLGLRGKSVLVMAASKGLGKAIALEYAAEGAQVAITSRNIEHLEQAAEDIRKATGATVLTQVMDVRNGEDISAGVDLIAKRHGGIDVVVTNAGGPPGGCFDDFDDQAWDLAYGQNLLSVVRVIRAALPYLRSGNGGRIVNLTSTSVKEPMDHMILSNTIRAGVNGLSKSLSVELAKDQILVNSAGPGNIATDRIMELNRIAAERNQVSVEQVYAANAAKIPLQRYGEPGEFAKMIVFLGSFANTYVTGQSVIVDGGKVRAY